MARYQFISGEALDFCGGSGEIQGFFGFASE
jgi:hypothetical protein